MEEFQATKDYCIHAFSAIKEWFGNRGIAVKREDLKEWAYDGDYLFYNCRDSAPEKIKPFHNGDVVYCDFGMRHFEINNEVSYDDSPFSKKILKGEKAMKKFKITISEESFNEWEVEAENEEEAKECIFDQIDSMEADLIGTESGDFSIIECEEIEEE